MKTKNMTIPNWCGKFVSALAVLSVSMFGTSCNDEELVDNNRKPLQLSVTANAPLVSRAIINDTYLPDGSQIGVTLTATDGSTYDNQDFYNLAYTASGTGAEQVWSSATPASLSTTSGKVIAYYPYNGSEELDLTVIPVETASQTDYMYAKPVTGINFTSADINLNMQHAMTDIRINLKKGTYTGTGEVTKVTAKAAAFATSATMDAETGVFANVSGSGAQFVQEFTDLTLTTTVYSQDFLMVPDTKSTSGEVSILTIIDGKKFAVTVPYTESFQQGYSYVYNLTLDNSGLVLEGVDVTKWSVKMKEEQELEFYDNQYIVEIQVPSDGYEFTPNILGYTGVVDWGDGSTTEYTSYTSYPEKHIYSTAGTYVFKLTGSLSRLGSDKISIPKGYLYPSKIITKLVRIGKEMGVKNMEVAFYNQKLLTEIVPGALDGCTKVTTFGMDYIGCFEGCTGLTNIPERLFDKCTEVTSFGHVFSSCSALTSIPEGLFDNCTKVTEFSGAFKNCSKITEIPNRLFDKCTEVTTFYETFSGAKIGEIPEGLFDYNTKVTNFGRCFAYCNFSYIPANLFINNTQVVAFDGAFFRCTKLTDIPGRLFSSCTEVTDFGGTFAECTSLTAIPEGLFGNNRKVTNFVTYVGNYNYGCFNGCTNLTSIPDGLFDACTEVITFGDNGADHDGIFGRCSSLTSIPSGLFDYNTKATNFSGIFHGCKNLQTIPDGLFDNNTEVLKFTGAFYGCESLQTIPAGLFDNNTKVTEISNGFYGIFRQCKSLTTIPTGLFDSFTNITKAANVFYNCNKITSIPVGLFDKCTEVTTFAGTFYECSITEIPEGLFDKCTKVTSFYETFYGCDITVIPQGLFDNCTEVTSFENTFRSTRVAEIPEGLFDKCTEVTNFGGTFYKTSISSIPTSLFDHCTKVTNFGGTFYWCGGLTGESPYTIINIDGVETKVHLYERSNYPEHFTAPTSYYGCFSLCSKLTDYNSLPYNWN